MALRGIVWANFLDCVLFYRRERRGIAGDAEGNKALTGIRSENTASNEGESGTKQLFLNNAILCYQQLVAEYCILEILFLPLFPRPPECRGGLVVSAKSDPFRLFRVHRNVVVA